MIFLYVFGGHFLLGAIGLLFTYHNPRSIFYGRLDSETITIGLLTGPGCFLGELFSLANIKNRVVFQRSVK